MRSSRELGRNMAPTSWTRLSCMIWPVRGRWTWDPNSNMCSTYKLIWRNSFPPLHSLERMPHRRPRAAALLPPAPALARPSELGIALQTKVRDPPSRFQYTMGFRPVESSHLFKTQTWGRHSPPPKKSQHFHAHKSVV